MRPNRPAPALRASLAALLALAAMPAAAAQPEGFKLEPGVVLDVTAVGIPEFHYKVPVSDSGYASFPLLPPMKVAGVDIADVRERLREGLSKKAFRTRGPTGGDNFINITPDEVNLDVLEYRPVYVNGDVSKPGEVPYRPGMTVRQAVAVAGGFDLLHSRASNPFMESADVRGEFDGTWTEYVKQLAGNLALKASLDGKPDTDIRKSLRAPLPDAVLDRIAQTEQARLKASEDDFKKEVAALKDGLSSADKQIASLNDQQKVLQDTVNTQTGNVARIRGLYDKQVVAINRMSDEQRQLSYASERLLQVTAQIHQAEVGRTEMARKLQAAGDQRRIKLLADLQEGTTKLEVLKARIGALDAKMVYTGAARSQLLGRRGDRPDVTIHRKGPNGAETIRAAEDDALHMGDVVEVAVRDPYATELPKSREQARAD